MATMGYVGLADQNTFLDEIYAKNMEYKKRGLLLPLAFNSLQPDLNATLVKVEKLMQ